MRAGKGNQEEDEYEEDEFGSSKKQGTSSSPNTNNTNKGNPLTPFYFDTKVCTLFLR